jgi:trans-aconitate methyltransferase
MTTRTTPDDILATYDRVAHDFHVQRNKVLFEKPMLDRMLGIIPRNQSKRRLLDIGCGTGAPIARYLSERGLAITGVDGAKAMVDLFAENVPNADVHHADMRTLNLGTKFDGVLAWDSFFHLTPDHQRAMFPIFAAHAAPNAALMFTSGPEAGEVWGQAVDGEQVYHASLDPKEYRAMLTANAFKVIDYRPEDPDCHGHTIWLARFTGE